MRNMQLPDTVGTSTAHWMGRTAVSRLGSRSIQPIQPSAIRPCAVTFETGSNQTVQQGADVDLDGDGGGKGGWGSGVREVSCPPRSKEGMSERNFVVVVLHRSSRSARCCPRTQHSNTKLSAHTGPHRSSLTHSSWFPSPCAGSPPLANTLSPSSPFPLPMTSNAPPSIGHCSPAITPFSIYLGISDGNKLG